MKHILTIDADRRIQEILNAGLRGAGYQVSAVLNADEALVFCTGATPDLAILDVCVGDVGIAVVECMEQRAIPFVVLASHGDQEIVQQAVSRGALSYLVKPLEIAQLLPAVETALSRAGDLRWLREQHANLRTALNQRRETSVAVGVLMERHGLSATDAFSVLRQRARDQRRKIVEVANEIVAASEVLSLSRQKDNAQ